jgi:hypothetical protein
MAGRVPPPLKPLTPGKTEIHACFSRGRHRFLLPNGRQGLLSAAVTLGHGKPESTYQPLRANGVPRSTALMIAAV